MGLEDCCLPSWLSDCDFPYFKYFYVHFLPISSNDSSNKHFCAHHLLKNHETYFTDMPEDGGFGGLLTLPLWFLANHLHNPILTKQGGQLCIPHCYCSPHNFGQCDVSVITTENRQLSQKLKLKPLLKVSTLPN